MRLTASMPMVKRCPYHDELDVGTVAFTWDREAPDLHDVASSVVAFAEQEVTHEAATQHLADAWECEVRTTWTTAGMAVEVKAVPAA